MKRRLDSAVGRFLSALTLTLATTLGVVAFLYPFVLPHDASSHSFMAHSADAPLIFLVLLLLCVVVIISSLETGQMNSKIIAVLGILVAINTTLRLIPGPAGFTAMLFIPILCGYVYGADFGFLLGSLSLLVSAVVTGGMGPWLPYQMFAAGWMGMASAWLPRLTRFRRAEILVLALWGASLGLIFGAIMNLWFWPYLVNVGTSATHWQPGSGAWETIGRYAAFYVTTSLWWDMGRALGNFALILLFGAPVLQLLRRFKERFQFVIE